MNWCFAVVNGRLAEVYFEKFRGRTRFLGHAYVDRKSFKDKKSQLYIKHDTEKFKFTFRNGKYKSKLDDKVFLLKKEDKVWEDYKKGENIFTANSVKELMRQLDS